MRLVSRRPAPVAPVLAALVLVVLVTGCGGSVADADSARPTRTAAPPSSPFCVAVAAQTAAIRPLNGLAARDAIPPAELAPTVDTVRRAGTDLLNTAPSEIRDDVQRTVDAVNVQLDALVAADGDAAAAAREPAVAGRLSSADLRAANERLGAYVEENCGTDSR